MQALIHNDQSPCLCIPCACDTHVANIPPDCTFTFHMLAAHFRVSLTSENICTAISCALHDGSQDGCSTVLLCSFAPPCSPITPAQSSVGAAASKFFTSPSAQDSLQPRHASELWLQRAHLQQKQAAASDDAHYHLILRVPGGRHLQGQSRPLLWEALRQVYGQQLYSLAAVHLEGRSAACNQKTSPSLMITLLKQSAKIPCEAPRTSASFPDIRPSFHASNLTRSKSCAQIQPSHIRAKARQRARHEHRYSCHT
jgi:hypothetical protein